MSRGFVIKISCEEFFKDARKDVALYFSEERLKSVSDLKQRLRILVKADFYVLWSPSGDDNYYFLMDDEQLHFVEPKDKFRICKITKSSAQQFTKQVFTVTTPIETERPNESTETDEVEHHIKTNGILEHTKEDLLMEYEDVVDQGSKKKRTRKRKHKSKRQKVEDSANETHVLNKTELTPIPAVFESSFCSVKENSRSHIHFELESKNQDQVDSKKVDTNKSEVEFIESTPHKKDKKKSRKKKPGDTCEPILLDDDNTTEVPITPSRSNNAETSNTQSVANSMVTSTVFNTPASGTKRRARRSQPTYSLASFISQLSDSLKHNTTGSENSEDVTVINKEASTPSARHTLTTNTDRKEVNHSNVKNETSKPFEIANSNEDIEQVFNGIASKLTSDTNSPNTSSVSTDTSYTDRKLRRNSRKSNESNVNGNQFLVLENLRQLKNSNYPNMPLVFERNFSHGRKHIENENSNTGNNTITSDEPSVANESLDTSRANGMTETSDNFKNGIIGSERETDTTQETLCLKSSSHMFSELYEEFKIMSDEILGQYPLVKEPAELMCIIFKVLKMDASYNPSLSNYVGATVRNVCSETKQLSLEIMFGTEELRPPRGKFSLEEDEHELVEEIVEHSLNWNEMFHTRRLHEGNCLVNC